MFGVEDAFSAGGAAGGVEEDAVGGGGVDGGFVLDVGVDDFGVVPVAEVDGGGGCGEFVFVDGGDGEVEGCAGHGVGADAAAEVPDVGDLGVEEAVGVAGGDLEAGGLFEAVGGEEHGCGEGAEFGGGFVAESALGEGCGDEVGVVALVSEFLAEGEGLVVVVGWQAFEELPAFGL